MRHQGKGGRHRGQGGGAPRGTAAVVDPGTLLYGRNALRELLRADPQRIIRVTILKDQQPPSPRKKELLDALAKAEIPCAFAGRDVLDRLAGSDAHQGFVAEIVPREPVDLKELLDALRDKEQATLLFLDEVQDPQNLGTILRAAECFAVDAVIWSRNRGAALTASARKASVGASEIVTIAEVGNLVDAIKKCKEAGYWVVGADAAAGSEEIRGFRFPEKAVFVLGAEGEGLKDLIKKNLDFSVRIPLHGSIDSLNVSQATAIFLYERAKSLKITAQ